MNWIFIPSIISMKIWFYHFVYLCLQSSPPSPLSRWPHDISSPAQFWNILNVLFGSSYILRISSFRTSCNIEELFLLLDGWDRILCLFVNMPFWVCISTLLGAQISSTSKVFTVLQTGPAGSSHTSRVTRVSIWAQSIRGWSDITKRGQTKGWIWNFPVVFG